MRRYGFWGLIILVAIPLPGTGAWTGALIAALLEMKVKSAFVTILLGMICAALIMTLGSMIVDGLISGQWPEDLQLLGDLLTGIRDYLSSLLSDHSVTVS